MQIVAAGQSTNHRNSIGLYRPEVFTQEAVGPFKALILNPVRLETKPKVNQWGEHKTAIHSICGGVRWAIAILMVRFLSQ